MPPEVPTSDLGGAVSELAKAPRPYPGGSKEAWERFRVEEAGAKVKVSKAEAIAAFADRK
jgi:hypothetical protein